MPLLSLGMMRSMHSWKRCAAEEIDPRNQLDLEHLVRRALELGIIHLETARGYGTSEEQLGQILRHVPRHRYILQTKVAPQDDPDRFRANVLDSMARLGQDRLDLLAVHGLNDYRSLWQVCRPGGCLAAARRLQAEGRVGWIGFSGHGSTRVILAAVRHQEDGGFDYLNLHWYTIFQRHTPVLEEARRRDLGVFIISPTDKGGMLQTPPPLLEDLSTPLSPMQFNDLFCLQREEIHTISVGAARPADFRAHLDALAHLDDHALTGRIYGRWEQCMLQRTGHRRPDSLWDRFPSWDETPGYINIPLILWLGNLARGWDLLAYSRQRYRKLGQDMPWVPGNDAGQINRYDLGRIAEQAGLTADDLVTRLAGIHRLLC